MGFTLSRNTTAASLFGVYSPHWITFTDTSIIDYFEVDVSYGDTLKTVRLYQDASDAAIDVHKLMEDGFSSDAMDPSLSIIPYTVHGRSYHSDDIIMTVNSDASNWIINGTKTNYDFYLYNSTNKAYLDNYSSNPKFLNDQTINRIYWNDNLDAGINDAARNKVNLSYLNGYFRGNTNSGYNSAIHKLEIIKYVSDVSTARTLTVTPETQRITSVDIDPSNLNLNVADLSINENTDYYTVADASGNSETVSVYLDPVNMLNDKYFRLGWINKNGVLNYYNFTYNYQKSLDIKRQSFNFMSSSFDQYIKTFNTEAKAIYNITTDWITEEDSKVLESLWTSPSVKASAFYTKSPDYFEEFGKNEIIWEEPIILDVKSMDIRRRRNSNLINYSINFMISEEYRVQKS